MEYSSNIKISTNHHFYKEKALTNVWKDVRNYHWIPIKTTT